MSAFKYKSDGSNFVELIQYYEDNLQEVEDKLRISGKTLQSALREQPGLYSFYAERRAGIKSWMKLMDDLTQSVRGELCKRYIENYSRQLGDRALNSYLDAEPSYLDARKKYLCVEEIFQRYDAVVDAFDKRGFALRDLTSALVAQVEQTQI